jgi:GWxTD domain-containing protein
MDMDITKCLRNGELLIGHLIPGRIGQMTKTTAILLLLVPAVYAAGLATFSNGGVDYAIDTAVFRRGVCDTLLLEVYQEIAIAQLSHSSENKSIFTTEISLVSAGGDTLAADIWNSEVNWGERGLVTNCRLLPVLQGNWTLTVSITDVANGMQGVAERELSVEIPGHFSEIELARTIMPAAGGSESSLLKGSIIVFPAASTRFTVQDDCMLYSYQEIYGLGGSEIYRCSRLLSPSGVTVFARPASAVAIPEGMETVALTDSIDLSVAEEPGLYSLSVVYTRNEDTLAVATKPFVVELFRPEAVSGQTAGNNSSRCLSELALLLSKEELEMYDRLDDEGKMRFYDTYWSGKSEECNGFHTRSSVVASRYSTMFKEGWETDRGRVYLTYGEPDEVESNPFSTTQSPLEIWSYYSSDQETFVFADLMGNGDYFQVYSTVEGEVSYSNWQEMIVNVGSGGSTGDDDRF